MSFVIVALVALLFVIIYQIAKASEYATMLRGEKKAFRQTNRIMAYLLAATFLVGMWGLYAHHKHMMPMMLGESASMEGIKYDHMFRTTTIITGIMFVLTQALLFFFVWRYQNSETKTSFFYPHNNKLELVWTIIPAITMAVLVAIGLKQWLHITDQAPANAQIVEVVGKQFNWIMRYPGADGALGSRYFTRINDANNVLGQDWSDAANHDDVVLENGELHVVKGRPVKLVIGSRDVIHDVGLFHFRMKMDAVPGITTTIWFTPRFTNEEMVKETGNPNFVYEIACDQMCGKGHYSMRGTVIVHPDQQDFNKWLLSQKSYYSMMNQKPNPAVADSTGTAPNGAAADTTRTTAMK